MRAADRCKFLQLPTEYLYLISKDSVCIHMIEIYSILDYIDMVKTAIN